MLSPLVEPYTSFVNHRLFLLSSSAYPLTTRLYLLFGPGIPGLPPGSGGVLEPLPFIEGRWLLEADLPDDPRVVGGDCLSNHELSVDELLFPLLVCCDRCSSLPSLLDEEFWSEAGVLGVLKEAFERRRSVRSFKKEGIAAGIVVRWSAACERLLAEEYASRSYRRLEVREGASRCPARRSCWKCSRRWRRRLLAGRAVRISGGGGHVIPGCANGRAWESWQER